MRTIILLSALLALGCAEDPVGTKVSSDWTTYTMSNGIAHNAVAGIAFAPDGALWCSHPVEGGGGVSHFDGTNWTNYTTENGLPSNLVLWFEAIAVSPDGTVWVGTFDNGLSRFDGETWTTYTETDGLLSNIVVALALAPNGDLWCAGPGLSRFDGESWDTYPCTDIGLTEYAFSIAVAQDGTVWAGGGGLTCYNGMTWTDHRGDHRLEKGPVASIAITSDDSVWVGGDGVSRFNGESWTHYTLLQMGITEIGDQGVTSLAIDPAGALWVGTDRQGVVRFDGETWTKKIAADVRALYGFTPDFDPLTKPPLVTFKEDDAQEFITEPGAGREGAGGEGTGLEPPRGEGFVGVKVHHPIDEAGSAPAGEQSAENRDQGG